MIPEDTVKLIQMRKNPVNSMQDLSKKLIGTREGFIFYTTNFRNDFETKMYMLGRLEEENQQLKSTLEEIREYIKEELKRLETTNDKITHCLSYQDLIDEYNNISQIIDKGVNNEL